MIVRAVRRLATPIVAAALLASSLPSPAVLAQSRPYADPAFQRIWERYDRPVELKFTTRSWTWGPNTPFNGYEPYKQGREGRRLVQYFDKTRMEINDPSVDPDKPFYVSNGLLTRELVSGRVALGDQADEVDSRTPATEAIAGDPAGVNEDAPTYATFREIASLANDRRAENRIGASVSDMINKQGQIRPLPSDQQNLANMVRIVNYDENLGHNIPDKFWDFLNQKGMIYDIQKGEYNQDGTVFQPWVYAMGVPITEPYWVSTKVGGTTRWVLVQLYERRVLTYTPDNPAGFQVEMGNVGQHYYRWRYQLPQECTDEEPTITSSERSQLTSTGVRIEWTTNKPTDSRLEYGTSTSYGKTTGTQTLATRHRVDITDLMPNTTYHFRIISRDCNSRTVVDTDHSFTTPASDA